MSKLTTILDHRTMSEHAVIIFLESMVDEVLITAVYEN